MKKLRIRIQNLKLSVKLICIVIFTCVVLLIMEIFGRKSVYEAYNEQLYEKTTQIGIAYVNQLETEINKIENLSFSIIGDTTIQEKLIYLKSNQEEFDYSTRKDLGNSLSSYSSILDYNAQIDIIFEYSQRKIGGVDSSLEDFIQIAKEKKGKSTVFAQGNKIGVFREIRRIQGLLLDHLGVLIIQVDLNGIMRDLEYSYAKLNVVPDVFIFAEGECIYSSSDTEEIPPLVDRAVLIDDQFIVPSTSSKLGWVFLLRIPYSDINESIRQADLRATIVSIVVAVVVCMFSAAVVYSLMPHINLLMRKFEMFGKGELSDPAEYPSYEGRTDEIGRLHNQFDKMAQEYQRVTQESYQNMLLLKDAQFQQLQQQIRPHFLFNTLSSIVWTAAEHNDMETAKIADALGKILRSSFRNMNSLVTVREEIKIVREYLYIQNLRYSERLKVEEALQEELLDVKLPSFTIQPIVENVIIHVVEKSLELCVIRIYGRILDNRAEIMIEDNGGGLDENILKKLQNGEIQAKGNGVGLSNVDARIKLAFSKEYGLSVFREKGCSRVIISLPYPGEEKGVSNDQSDVGR